MPVKPPAQKKCHDLSDHLRKDSDAISDKDKYADREGIPAMGRQGTK